MVDKDLQKTTSKAVRHTSSQNKHILHAFPRSAPTKGAKICTYRRWFVAIGPVPEPLFRLSLSDRCVRRLFWLPAWCLLKQLVDEGRLDVVNSGWVQHDEAAAHYVAMIDQTTRCHRCAPGR